MDSVRLSSIECFFNESCMNIVMELLTEYLAPSFNISILLFNSSRFVSSTKMSYVIDALMIDQWNLDISYKNYYNQCEPLQCSYTYTTRGDLLYILSTIFGIFGGLIIVLKVLVRIIVRSIRNRIKRPTVNSNTIGRSSKTLVENCVSGEGYYILEYSIAI